MATPNSKTLASTLYRAILSSAKRYGESAQKRALPARKEMETFNSVLKATQLPLPESGVMSPQIAMSAVKRAFHEQSTPQESQDKINDAFAMLRKLYQKEGILKFPQSASSECITDGCKVAVKSCYSHERSSGWYLWDYNIKIYNNTEVPLRLFSEKLRLLDENLAEKKTEAPLINLVKPLPVIKPGHHFEFTKRVPIWTKTGSLSGSYLLMDVQSGKLIEAPMTPILLTQQEKVSERSEETFTEMDASLSTSNIVVGDEEMKGFEPLPKDGARRRRLRREELQEKQESSDAASESDKSEMVIPDSELKKQIRRHHFHFLARSQSSPLFSPKFNKSHSHSNSSRSRAIQRAAPLTSEASSSASSPPPKNEQLELEPEEK